MKLIDERATQKKKKKKKKIHRRTKTSRSYSERVRAK